MSKWYRRAHSGSTSALILAMALTALPQAASAQVPTGTPVPFKTAPAGTAGLVWGDHPTLILAARTGSFTTGVATHGCTADDPGRVTGVEARTAGTFFGAFSIDLATVSGGGRCEIVRDSLHDPNAPPRVYVPYNGQGLTRSPRFGLYVGVISPPFPVRVGARLGVGVLFGPRSTTDNRFAWTGASLEAVFLEHLAVGYERGSIRIRLDSMFIDGTVNALMGGAEIDDWVTTERYWIGLQIGLF